MTAKLIKGYEVVIGFETHAQLATNSKIFSRASTAFGAEPNTQACAVDLALPGTLPVMNREAVECAIKLGLALGCHDCAAQHLCAQELLLPRPAQGLPDQPVRDSRGARRRGVSFYAGRRDSKPCAWCAPTWKKTRANPCTTTSIGRVGHRPEPRGHAAAGDRDRARHPLAPKKPWPTPRSCTRSSPGLASATATCKKARSAATPTCRCASPASRWAPAARSRT